MPYVPPTDEPDAYQCGGCGRWYVLSDTACVVAHVPGTCCHIGEREIQPDKVCPGTTA